MAIISPGVIHLQPDTPQNQQIQLINDNFQTVTNLLQTNSFKIAQEGTWTNPTDIIPVAAGAGLFNEDIEFFTMTTHNLGYAPAILGYYGDGSVYHLLPHVNNGNFSTTNAGWQTFEIYTTTTELRFRYTGLFYGTAVNTYPAGSIAIKWYILQETSS